jgi:hypothetical protein
MNRKQSPVPTPDPIAPGTDRAPPLEAEVRTNDLALDRREDTRGTDAADDEATPGEGENAAGFLKQRKR